MGLLGNGDDSSLTSNTGWGMMPPMNSGADWTAMSSNTTTSTTGNSSSTIGANSNNHNFQTGSISSTVSCWQTPAATSSLINNGRSSQLVSTNSATSVAVNSINHEQHALSASPKLSSSWAQAAGKGLNTSSNSNSSHIGPNSQANQNSSNNVILQSSNNSNALAVSSSSTSDYRSSIATNGPNQNIGVTNNFSHDSYSAAINNGSNNQQSSMNSNGTTGSCSSATASLSSAFQQATIAQHGANNSSIASLSSENGSGVCIGNKRAITNANIQDIIGNLSDDVRETLLTEKWRLPVINQDSPWNLPPSEQTSPKDTSQWRSPVNSGTEIWENTVRQKKGSQPNVGGNLMITNNDGLSSTVGGIGMHADGSGSAAVGSSQSWNPPTVTHSIGGTWGEEEDTTNLWVSTPITPVGNANTSSGNSLTSINNWSSNGSNNVAFNNNNWNNAGVSTDLVKTYDSGKNNSKKSWNTYDNPDTSANEPNWDKINDNFGTWQPDQTKKESGWDKESNDNCKGSVDDGTAVWGNPVRQTKVSNWKDNPANKNGLLGGWNKSNVGGNSGPSNGNHKSNQMQNRTWVSSSTDSAQRKSPLWNDDTNSAIKVNGNTTSSWPTESNSSLFWPDSIGGNNIVGAKLNQNQKGHGNGNSGGVGSASASNTAMPTQNSWMDSTQMDNNHWNQASVNNSALSNRQQHNLTNANQKYSREIIQSNQYKTLIGFKKDNVETALRNNQMRPDDAMKELKNMPEDDLSLRTNQCALSNDRLRLFNAQNSATATVTGAPIPSNVMNALNNNNKQMFTLLQGAISAGIINPQLLSRPMSAQNIEVLSDILQQYKLLRQLQESRDASAQTKLPQIQQKIANLQNQIVSSYQASNSQFLVPRIPLEQTANRIGANSVTASSTNSIDYFKSNSSTGGNGNNNTGNDLSSFDFGTSAANQGSRLNSWKSQLKSDERSSNSNFIRAPGPISKQNSISNSNWPSTFGNSSDDGSNWNADKGELHASTLIDEYDYDSFDCKTWKSHNAKALDDDTRTLLNMPKDFPWNNKPAILNSQTDSFGGSFSTPANPNTWSYNPLPGQQSTSNTNIFDLGLATNKTAPKKSNWGNANDYTDSLWSGNSSGGASGQPEHNVSGATVGNKSRPPPGLSGKIAGNGNGQTSVWNSSGLSANTNNSATTSEYLRLRNLTPQIDGSTLKTLCLQHGPLNQFHLSLNHGVAIVRYSTRDQAIKAQSALNNCVLGNTTIIADLPPDNELSQFSMIISGGSAIQQQQSNTNNINSLASSWSNGTNASHSVAVGAAGSANGTGSGQSGNNGSIQSYQTQNHQAAVVQHRTAIQANTGGNANNNSAASTSQTLPYGTTHSATHSFRPSSVNSGSNQFNGGNSGNSKMVDSGMGVWNSNMWDLSNAGATAPTGGQSSGNNLWSAAGFSNTDRNTPIQNFLPNDLLAGENN